MNISGLQYNLNRKTLEIYISGCFGECDGCHNKELWDFSVGKDFREYLKKIHDRIESGLVENIWILGGDPIDQNLVDLEYFLVELKKYNKEMWLWTRYELQDIPKSILNFFNIVKTGKYDKNLESYFHSEFDLILASKNQKIIKLK